MFPVLFAIVSGFPLVFGADILAIFSIPSYSHQIVYRNLMLELNRRGHNLTIITPNPVKDQTLQNYHQIDMSFTYERWNREVIAKPEVLRVTQSVPELFVALFTAVVSPQTCEIFFNHPPVQDLIRRNPKFDLLVTEFGANPCFYGFARFTGYKHAGVFSLSASVVVYADIGNPGTLSYIPDVMLPYSGQMTFLQRFRNFAYASFMWLVYFYTMRSQDSIARKYLGSDLESLVDIERNVSVLLVNTHPAMTAPRPNVPNVVEIGGPAFHLIGQYAKPLPQDIKDFVDYAPNGVIYFSLGTNVKTGNMSSEIEKTLLDSFARLKQRVLWKWENQDLKVNLKNVKVGKWFPQIDVLAHPNVKAFVTQGGLQSISEAIEYHVPMVVLPFFADQSHNAKKMQEVGVAEVLDFDTLTTDILTQTLNKVINNYNYTQNIIRFSELVKDQPMAPLEKAVWWTEYVIRHNGAPHLRSPAARMPWYKYLNLDVLAFILLTVAVIFYVLYLILKTIYKTICKSKKTKKE